MQSHDASFLSQCLCSNDGLYRCAFTGVLTSMVGYLLLMTITFKLKIAEMLMASVIAAQCQVFDSSVFDVKVNVEHQPAWLRSVLPILDLLFATHQEPYFCVWEGCPYPLWVFSVHHTFVLLLRIHLYFQLGPPEPRSKSLNFWGFNHIGEASLICHLEVACPASLLS